jgi:hypothetical protein
MNQEFEMTEHMRECESARLVRTNTQTSTVCCWNFDVKTAGNDVRAKHEFELIENN